MITATDRDQRPQASRRDHRKQVSGCENHCVVTCSLPPAGVAKAQPAPSSAATPRVAQPRSGAPPEEEGTHAEVTRDASHT